MAEIDNYAILKDYGIDTVYAGVLVVNVLVNKETNEMK